MFQSLFTLIHECNFLQKVKKRPIFYKIVVENGHNDYFTKANYFIFVHHG